MRSIALVLMPIGAFFLSSALAGCTAPLQHQQRLSVLHTQAARSCTAKTLTCAALAPCSTAVRAALADWQAVSVAASKGDDTAEAAALIIASTSELAAITACKGVR